MIIYNIIPQCIYICIYYLYNIILYLYNYINVFAVWNAFIDRNCLYFLGFLCFVFPQSRIAACISVLLCHLIFLFFLFFFIYFYQLEANYFTTFQWVLSYIDMNQPWSHMYSPSRSPLPPPSPPDSSGSSQCTRPEHLSHASNLGW